MMGKVVKKINPKFESLRRTSKAREKCAFTALGKRTGVFAI
jgi:hypothetical protein